MDFAVVRFAGRQYFVSPGEKLVVAGVAGKVAEKITLGEVLLVAKEGVLKIGQPTVEGAKVLGKIVSVSKSPKLMIIKFKAKTRYRRRTGFRSEQTTIEIENA